MTFPDYFSGVAAGYAQHRPGYPDAVFDWLALTMPGAQRAWDCATGSGQAALGLARFIPEVVATDASAEQLAQARRHPRIQYRQALAHASGLPNQSMDLVTVAQAAHWFDQAPFHAEVHRVLRRGGALAIWGYGAPGLPGALGERFFAFCRDRLEPYWPPERRHIESGYRDLPFPFAEEPWAALHMTATWTLPQLLGYLSTWSAVTAYRRHWNRDPLHELADVLRADWEAPEHPQTLTWPLFGRFGRC